MGNVCGRGRRASTRVQRSTPSDLRPRVMINNVIMEKIAEKLSPHDLLILRRTCTHWNQNFIPQLKKKHEPISLSSNGESSAGKEDLLKILQSSSEVPFTSYSFCPNANTTNNNELIGSQVDLEDYHRFMDVVQELGCTITTLHIVWHQSSNIGSPTQLTIGQLRQIIFEWTPHLVELRLEAPVPARMVTMTETQHTQLKKLPNLKRLKVALGDYNFNQIPRDLVDPAFIQLVSDVFDCADGGLEYLDLYDDALQIQRFANNYNGATLLELFRNWLVDDSQRLRKLKTIHAYDAVSTEADLQVLVELAQRNAFKADADVLRLSSLCMTLMNFAPLGYNLEITSPLLQSLLFTQSASLTELELSLAFKESHHDPTPIGFPTSWGLPRMENLRKLKLYSINQTYLQLNEASEGPNLRSFMDTFPKLKQFSYNFDENSALVPDGSYDYLQFPFVGQMFHPGVTDLETSARNGGDLARIHSMFPSLSHLKLVLYGKRENETQNLPSRVEEFSKIWTLWPSLTSLHLAITHQDILGGDSDTDGTDLDRFVSGVTKDGLKRIRTKMNSKKICSKESLGKMVKKHKSLPGISDLKQLQQFTIFFHPKETHPRPLLIDPNQYFLLALSTLNPTPQALYIQEDLGNGMARTYYNETPVYWNWNWRW